MISFFFTALCNVHVRKWGGGGVFTQVWGEWSGTEVRQIIDNTNYTTRHLLCWELTIECSVDSWPLREKCLCCASSWTLDPVVDSSWRSSRLMCPHQSASVAVVVMTSHPVSVPYELLWWFFSVFSVKAVSSHFDLHSWCGPEISGPRLVCESFAENSIRTSSTAGQRVFRTGLASHCDAICGRCLTLGAMTVWTIISWMCVSSSCFWWAVGVCYIVCHRRVSRSRLHFFHDLHPVLSILSPSLFFWNVR